MESPKNFDLVLFGATGDLAMRKLLPALYHAHAAGRLHPLGRILGASRSRLTRAGFVAKAEQQAKPDDADPNVWASFAERLDYHPLDMDDERDFAALAAKIHGKTDSESTVFYLSTAPKFFTQACRSLAAHGLNGANARVVLEKPLGTDLESCRLINDGVAQYFQEHQTLRIDHYLGKSGLQNLLALRFGNSLFEPLWNNRHIRSVQITLAETLGVEERGEFYDTIGALRDMVQNHIIQILCLTAMERPQSLSAGHLRDAKLQLIRSLRPLDPERDAVFGQYAFSDGLKGYTQEHKVPAASRTETYAALCARIDTPRWEGVPFYLRTGKRLARRSAEIVIGFRPLSDGLFPTLLPNRLVISLQAEDETVRLRLNVKTPDGANHTVPAEACFDTRSGRRPSAYETLLLEAIAGRAALFNRRDELEAAWAWLAPALTFLRQHPRPPHPYPAGSSGPAAAERLLAQGDTWFEGD
ncbi:Glucose-6-phosphate 1-dehydrogenase [Kingella potus]|uniref:Glucose-6-phosphate 1-dehydrogenase n=1 Tax=Kingella potus TaxID=265175 RepID=A0A377QXE4_9NEIS|nr:glucose-6-phosphate dehydrogenase [Kingella potus]UOP01811.1 glucose-6-phosphate dehydrogenase [Kingella potus]STQ99873.1 Glucose-6-phosphate 1-dehydrogenase [Kingella potus]